ncbi:MAG: DEAD/DEAH box helicase [Oscillospiraceae bacterium]|nr:DEAD/DEAH box helicase [Oscillospiraceae bacterium]
MLYKSQRVTIKKQENTEVFAEVEASGDQKNYNIFVRFNHQNKDKIDVATCDCVAFRQYKGFCKHIIATILAIQANAPKVRYSDVGVQRLIEAFTKKIVNKVSEKTCKIISILNLGDGIPYLSFKIKSTGTERSYVVQSLNKLKYNFEIGASSLYGKNLEIIHCKECFSPESIPILNFFLRNWDEFKNEKLAQYLGMYLDDSKFMILDSEMFEEYLKIVPENDFFVSDGGKPSICKIIDKAYIFKFKIEEEKSGYNLKFANNINPNQIIKSGDHIYIYRNDEIIRVSKDISEAVSPIIFEILKSYKKSIFVAEKDITVLMTGVIKPIEPFAKIEMPEKLEKLKPPNLVTKVYFDKYDKDGAKAKMTFSYGEKTFGAFEPKYRDIAFDLAGEITAEAVLKKYLSAGLTLTSPAEVMTDGKIESLYLLATEGISEISKFSEVYLSEDFKNLKVRPPVSASVGVKVKGGLLDINFDLQGLDLKELSDVLKSYKHAQKYHRLKDGSFITIQNSTFEKLAEVADELDLSPKELAKGNAKMPLSRAFYLDKTLKSNESLEFNQDKQFKDLVHKFFDDKKISFKIPPSLSKTLRNYQKIGYKWFRKLSEFKFGGILADDMGLGKTLQVLTLLLSCKQENTDVKPSMVVCPASLVLNWESESNRFTPELKVITINGNAAQRDKKIQEIHDFDLAVTSYDYLKRDIEKYEKTTFNYVIIDEAQFIKNQNTQSAKAVKALIGKTRFALTGTPIENSLAELWSIFDFLMPGFLLGYSRFKKKFESPIVKNQDKEATKKLHEMVKPFIVRRLKSDVLKELPEKTESIIKVEAGEEQKKIYTATLVKLKSELAKETKDLTDSQGRIKILAALTKMRQICCDPSLIFENYTGKSAKTEVCIELIESGVESGHRILLFSQFTSMLDILEEKLRNLKTKYFRLDGSTPSNSRLEMVNNFNANENTKIFLISLKAGGTGLNLIGADMVIHFDPWWNVSAQNQATDRAYRIGQKQNVSVYKLIVKETVEERILEMQKRKARIADAIVQKGGDVFSKLSKDELLGLFE